MSLVQVQLGEPNKDNSFDTKTVVLFLCLKRLNHAVCRLCAYQGYACNLAFLNGKLPIISIFTVFLYTLYTETGKMNNSVNLPLCECTFCAFRPISIKTKITSPNFRRGCLLLFYRFYMGIFEPSLKQNSIVPSAFTVALSRKITQRVSSHSVTKFLVSIIFWTYLLISLAHLNLSSFSEISFVENMLDALYFLPNSDLRFISA